MALTPNFDRIVATITQTDIDRFLKSSAPDDDKQRVRDAGSIEVRMRLVGGYLIRTNQITPERLDGKPRASAAAARKPRPASKVSAGAAPNA